MQNDRHSDEAQIRWDNTDAYNEYTEKTKNYTADKWADANKGLMSVFAEFARLKSNDFAPDSTEAKSLVKKLQSYISKNYYTCTDEILAGLGRMYVADERFKKNIDKHGEGTADFVAQAIDCCLNDNAR